MKIAVVYNRESKNVVNLFGMPNQEKIGRKTIDRLVNALKACGHRVIAVEGDKDLVDRLEEFMPRVVKGERPGMVFNVSYGIQGQARYTHVPSILEMIGVPYVGSGPLAHSLSLDKVVTKMILRQHDLPTPDFAVLDSPDASLPELAYPMIVKPKNEAVSFGLRVVNDEDELREGARVIFEKYKQPVLVEQFIEGREINVGLLGNNPPEPFPPVELKFPSDGPGIYTYEDKTGRSGRSISTACPAPVGDDLLEHAQEIAVKAFGALGCADCARVDMRLDDQGRLYILEINSLPSLGEHGSYLVGAAHVGLDFAKFVQRLVEVASSRYFGTPKPPSVEAAKADPTAQAFSYVTERRDRIERSLKDWVNLGSRTTDPVGLNEAVRRADRRFRDLGLKPVDDLTDPRVGWAWQTDKGLDGGVLFVGHLDVPTSEALPTQHFRREPEWLYGEGIGSSRAPLTMLEYALRAARSMRRLRKIPLGVLLYTDEGRDARYSAELIRKASARASRVLVLRPASPGDGLVVRRRGQRKYRFRVSGAALRPGKAGGKRSPLRWTWNQLEALCRLTDNRRKISVQVSALESESHPMRLPHRVQAMLLATYPDAALADELETGMHEAVAKGGARWELSRIADRPAMVRDPASDDLAAEIEQVAERWEIPFETTSSGWPSVAGLVPDGVARVCGVGPVARDVGTPHESVLRISLIQRTLLLAQYLVGSSHA